ncbi:MAG: WbqC family protein [Aeromicrobium sp.]
MIIASRPADLLPPSGFWYDLATADLLDLRIFDPIHARSPQRRVMMRGQWASIPIVGGAAGSLISEARILPVDTPRVLTELVTERYSGAAHWGRYGPRVVDLINEVHTDHLWQFNLHLILGIRELLDIRTPVSIGRAPTRGGGDGLASVMAEYKATTYLSEPAGRAYVGGDESYEQDGLTIAWSAHRPTTGDSILSVLMDHDDPMAVVLAEESQPLGRRPVGGLPA